MSKPNTRWVLIVDKSGSMADTVEQTIQGINEKIQQTKEYAKEQNILCSFVTFNGEIYEHLWDVNANELVEISQNEYKPTGATAMRDALGYTIQKLMDTVPKNDEEWAYLIDIISDGKTNDDKHYKTIGLLENMIGFCNKTGRWTFNYMGCDEVSEVAKALPIPKANFARWKNSDAASAGLAFAKHAARNRKFYESRAEGVMATANYASDGEGIADFASAEEGAELKEAPSKKLEIAKEFAAAIQRRTAVEKMLTVAPLAVEEIEIETGESWVEIKKLLPAYSNVGNKVQWLNSPSRNRRR